MAVERRLTAIVGPVGGKLHTARSRNDQVATDLALFTRAHALGALDGLRALQATLLDLAERHLDWAMPGYTHLQRAQPVYLSHHLLAYFWMFRPRRPALPVRARLDRGAAARRGRAGRASTSPPTAGCWPSELGFAAVAPNSIDAVSNRDFVLDYLAAAATCATHLSRLGAEIVLWSSEEFGFCEVSDAWASGSSIMPQKKNPDAAELLRAKAPRVTAHLVGLHGVLHGLPLTYNKDLQEDKEHLFDAVDTLDLSLAAARGMLAGIAFRRERLAAAAADEMIAATDVADLLVRRGVPFRQSHGIVAGLVRETLEAGPLAVRAHPRGARAPLARARRRVLRAARAALVARVEGLRGRHRAAARARAARPRARRARRPARVSALPADFYARPVVEVARALVGCVVRHDGRAGAIVETEAYHESEPACHALRRPDRAHAGPVRPAGRAYVYRSYGIHALAQRGLRGRGRRRGGADPGAGAARGRRRMRERRGLERREDLCSGPGKLTQALGIELDLNGSDLVRGPIAIEPPPADWPPIELIAGPRIGITKAAELPWRFCAAGFRSVSRPWPPGCANGRAARARLAAGRWRAGRCRPPGPSRRRWARVGGRVPARRAGCPMAPRARALSGAGAVPPPVPPPPPVSGAAAVGAGAAGRRRGRGAGRRARAPSVASFLELRRRVDLEHRLHERLPDPRRVGAAGDGLAVELRLHRLELVRVADPHGDGVVAASSRRTRRRRSSPSCRSCPRPGRGRAARACRCRS